MKQSDFDRLKAVCEKEGFELLNESPDDNDKYFVVKKAKDIWDGVEFAECILTEEIVRITDEIKYITKGLHKPSTESAYIEQLKAEAFKRFGEIKEGDRFDRSWAYESWPNPAIIGLYKRGFYYNKEDDQLSYNGSVLYEKGKWATRVPDRVKVKFFNDSLDEHDGVEEWGYFFRVQNHNYGSVLSNESGRFLASKLEKYLNEKKQ